MYQQVDIFGRSEFHFVWSEENWDLVPQGSEVGVENDPDTNYMELNVDNKFRAVLSAVGEDLYVEPVFHQTYALTVDGLRLAYGDYASLTAGAIFIFHPRGLEILSQGVVYDLFNGKDLDFAQVQAEAALNMFEPLQVALELFQRGSSKQRLTALEKVLYERLVERFG